MTTNDAVELARSSFGKLGYKPEDFQMNSQPTRLEGPIDSKRIGHVPFCRVVWDSPEANTREERLNSYHIQFDIDMQRKQVVGMSLASTNFWQPDPKIGVEPELESDYLKRIQGHMFVRTNAVSHLPAVKPAVAPPVTPSE